MALRVVGRRGMGVLLPMGTRSTAMRACLGVQERTISTTLPLCRGSKAEEKARAAALAEGKEASLSFAVKQIESAYGKGALMKLGDRPIESNVSVIPTGSLALDIGLGCGGLPRGRVVEIYGPESSGKTSLALHVLAEAQKRGGNCTFIDAEHALDPQYAAALGVNIENLYLSQPDSGEQALEIADTLIRSGAMEVVVVDSVAALVPRAELEGEMGDPHIALQARLMSQALRKLTVSLARSNCLLVFINQIRMKIGILFGNPEVTAGGNALRFYSSVRIEVRKKGQIKQGDQVIGSETRAKITKNKLAPPFKEVTFDIIFGSGIDKEAELIDLGVQCKLLKRSGAWISYNDSLGGLVEEGARLGQGKEKAKSTLKENGVVSQALEDRIRTFYFSSENESPQMNASTDEPHLDTESEEATESAGG